MALWMHEVDGSCSYIYLRLRYGHVPSPLKKDFLVFYRYIAPRGQGNSDGRGKVLWGD